MNIFQRPIFRVMCAGLLAGAIVGCGNKGPLVLPARPAVVEPVTPVMVQPAAQSSEDDAAQATDDSQPVR